MILVLFAVYIFWLEAVAGDSVYISADDPSNTFLSALNNPAVTTIYFKTDYDVKEELAAYSGVQPPLPLTRAITLAGVPGTRPQLDMNFQYGVLEICSNCTVVIRDMGLARDRRGTGPTMDFFVGEPGSVLLLNNTYRQRPACTSRIHAEQLILNSPRSPRFPGPAGKEQEQVIGAINVTYKGHSYTNALYEMNLAVDVPQAYQEVRGLQGGFTLVVSNSPRLCDHTVSDECLMVKSPEACINELIDSLANAQNASGTSKSSINVIALVVPLVVAVVFMSLAAALFLYTHKRRKEKHAAANVESKKSSVDGRDMESGVLIGKGVDRAQEDHDAGLQMQQKGWLLTHSSTAPQMGPVQDNRVEFGVLLGAGSFGKVYRGWWAGRDVAIKVIEHNKSNAAAVENEVMLMLQFDHPNIVRAYHFVTYTMGAGSTSDGQTPITGDTSSSAGGVGSHRVSDSAENSSSSELLGSSSRLGKHTAGVQGYSSSIGGPAVWPAQQRTEANRTPSPSHGEDCRYPWGQTQLASPGASPTAAAAAAADCSRPGTGLGSPSRYKPAGLGNAIRDIHAAGGGASPIAAAIPSPRQTQQWPDTPRQQIPARGKSPPEPQQQQQGQRHLQDGLTAAGVGVSAEAVAASGRPGSPRPGSQPGSTTSQHPGSADSRDSWALRNTPLSETIDTSRWPGIIDHVSAQSTAQGQKASSRAKTWLVLEFCDLGTLSNAAEEWSPDREGDEQMLRRLTLLQDAAKGLQALHAKNVVHGDLNARNVLVTSNPSMWFGRVAKLADLGLSRVVKQHQTHRTTNTVGTMSHMAPELLRYGRMSPAVDVFAFGIMMWEMFTGQVAFRTLHYGQFFEMVVLRNQRPSVPQNMPEDYQLLMEHCWSAAPTDRPNPEMLIQCLGLMINDRQAAIMQRSSLQQLRLAAAPPAAPEPLRQQQQQHEALSRKGSSQLTQVPHSPGVGYRGAAAAPAAAAGNSSSSSPRYPAASRAAMTALRPAKDNNNSYDSIDSHQSDGVHQSGAGGHTGQHAEHMSSGSGYGGSSVSRTSVCVPADAAVLEQQQPPRRQQLERSLQTKKEPAQDCGLENSHCIESW